MSRESRILFREEQRYDQWWIWVILIAATAVAVIPVWYGFYIQVTTGRSWGDDPVSNGMLAGTAIFTTLLMAALLALFMTIRLQLEIRDDGVHFRYLPLIRKWRTITKENIDRFEVGKYRPVGRYGGWGIRIGFRRYGRAFNVSGNTGLRLYLKDGKTILFGTRRAQAIRYAMEKIMACHDDTGN